MTVKIRKGAQKPKLQIFGMLGCVIIGIALVGGMVCLLIWQNSILLGAPIVCIMIGLIFSICEMWSNYRLAKKNFEIYRVKKWVENCLKKIKEGKIPETEYRFSGEKQGDYICIETVRVQWQDLKNHHFPNDHTPCREIDSWKVISFNDGEKTVHGILRRKEWAYGFLFYLAAKRYADTDIEKWHWGFDVF